MLNNDLISRAAAINAVYYKPNYKTAIEVLKEVPAVDAVPIRRGHWIDRDGQYECSECHNIACCRANYCPDCGSKMIGGKNDETY